MKVTQPKVSNINEMDTLHIIWHVVYRHRVILLILSNVTTLLLWLMQQAPVAFSNFMQ